MSDDGSFLTRWSKRKHDALAQRAEEAQETTDAVAQEREEESEDKPFDLAALPDIEALTGQSDISAFMHKAVPEALRNAALRKIWAQDPAVRDYVGEALDYAWDWNSPGGVPGFGDIAASEQTLEFARNLLAGPREHENVIDSDVTKHNEPPPAAIGEETSEARGAESGLDPQAIGNTDRIVVSQQTATHINADSPSPRKHRHGGALPS